MQNRYWSTGVIRLKNIKTVDIDMGRREEGLAERVIDRNIVVDIKINKIFIY